MLHRASKRPFRWSGRAHEAAVLVADDHLTDREIAAKVGVHVGTLETWKQHPEFREAVEAERLAALRRLRHATLTAKEARLAQLEHGNSLAWAIIEGRANSERHNKAAGGHTGLVIVSETTVRLPNGATRTTYEEKVDVALLAEIRNGLKQIAQEVGQWRDKAEITGANGDPLQHELSGKDGGPIVYEGDIPDEVLRWIAAGGGHRWRRARGVEAPEGTNLTVP